MLYILVMEQQVLTSGSDGVMNERKPQSTKSVPKLETEAELMRALEEYKEDQEIVEIVDQLKDNYMKIKDLLDEFNMLAEQLKKIQ